MAKNKWEQDKFRPENPEKYKGTLPIIYRSSWERRVFYFLDRHPGIIEWGSESIIIPYKYKIDNTPHRYYIDVNFIMNDKNGNQKRYLIEIKPKAQTVPPKQPVKKTPKSINRYNEALLMYQKNLDKWEAAEIWAKNNGYIFNIWTEETLGLL